MNWKEAGNIVDSIIKNKGGNLKDRIERAWENTGESKKAEVKHYSNGIITLKVKHSAYLQELSFKREEIKDSLNSELDIEIKKIKFIFS